MLCSFTSHRKCLVLNIYHWKLFGSQYIWLKTVWFSKYITENGLVLNVYDWKLFGSQYIWLKTIWFSIFITENYLVLNICHSKLFDSQYTTENCLVLNTSHRKCLVFKIYNWKRFGSQYISLKTFWFSIYLTQNYLILNIYLWKLFGSQYITLNMVGSQNI